MVGEGRNWPRVASVSLKMNLVLVTHLCVYDTINCVLIFCCRLVSREQGEWEMQMSVLLWRHHVACLCVFLSHQIWNNRQEFIQSDLIPVRVSYHNGGLHVKLKSLCRPLS